MRTIRLQVTLREVTPPVLLVGFVIASGLTSIGVIPASWHPALTYGGTFLITTALSAIGLTMRLSDMRQAGPRPLIPGASLWILVGVSSLVLQSLTGTL